MCHCRTLVCSTGHFTFPKDGRQRWLRKRTWRSTWVPPAGGTCSADLTAATLALEEVYRFENGAVEVLGSLYWDLLGLWTHVRNGMRAAGSRMGADDRLRGRGHLGRRFRALGPRRRPAGQPFSLPRPPHQRHDGAGLLDRPPRRDLPPHRPAVHAVQHPVPTLGHEAGQLAAPGNGQAAAHDAGPVPLADDRREVERVYRRHDHPVLQPGPGRLGHGAAGEVRPAHRNPRADL